MIFEHLEDINQTYFDHLKDAIYYSFKSFQAGIYFLIHGLYPDIFTKTGSAIIFDVNSQINGKYKK